MSKIKIDWSKKAYQPGDECEIIKLFEKVFGKAMATEGSDLEHWQWEFAGRPEKDVAILLAWDGDRLAGQYAAGPVMLSVDGSKHLAALSYDTMTDPEYQGQGIFTTLAHSLFAQLAGRGYHAIFGFPNGNSIYGFINKLEWKRICAPPVFVRPVSTAHILTEKLSIPPLLAGWIGKVVSSLLAFPESIRFKNAAGEISIREESQFGEWADTLWEKCKMQNRIWVVRNKAYLNWRYIEKPFNRYHVYSAWKGSAIAGYVVVCREQKYAGTATFIMDMMVDQNCLTAAHALLHKVISIAAARNDTLVCALVASASLIRRIFLKHGFFKLPKRLFPQELHFAGRLLCEDADNDFFYEPNSWGLSWGDDDVL